MLSLPGAGVKMQVDLVEMRYAVHRDFGLYQVDLHFHSGAGQ